MLEAKNIFKTYKPKKGPPVNALVDVSIKLQETGLVFILGKSGSGKSTLLNVLGGLDSCDSGDIIVKGKSSKDFSQSDFDSYRNTYIGFVFQEYNILNEFSVGQNIALAMELQGQKATTEKVNEILEEVDMAGYANRKPNELSGGQKQRVAIARALIKNPEIIMADEPTGALDSNTGIMVFDTLKKLAEKKLVVVVSHDRDFAEQYGDRVIELADGKIVSDILKYRVAPDKKNEGIDIVDDKIIHIKSGYVLTDGDVKLINEYLSKNTQTDTIISLYARTNSEVKKFARIDDGGNREAFEDTEESKLDIKEYEAADFKLIKSRLPYKKAVKIGASGLKTKPVRLFFTILLSAVAFVLFGISFTAAAYNKVNTTVTSMEKAAVNYTSFNKKIVKDYGNGHTYETPSAMNDKDLRYLKEKFPEADLVPVYNPYLGYGGGGIQFSNAIFDESKIYPETSGGGSGPGGGYYGFKFYNPYFTGIIELTAEKVQSQGFALAGRLPALDNEIVITQYAYEMFKLGGYKDGETKVEINSEEDIRGKTIVVNAFENYYEFKIVGVLNTNFNSERYDAFKPGAKLNSEEGMKYNFLNMELMAVLNYSFHTVAVVNGGLTAKLITEMNSGISTRDPEYNIFFESTAQQEGQYFHPSRIYSDDDVTNYKYLNSESSRALGAGDIAVSVSSFFNWCMPSDWDNINEFQSAFYTKYNELNSSQPEIDAVIGAYNHAKGVAPSFAPNLNFRMSFMKYTVDTNPVYFNFTVKALISDSETDGSNTKAVLPAAIIGGLDVGEAKYYSCILGKAPSNTAALKKMVEFSYEANNGVTYSLVNGVTESLGFVNYTIESFKSILLYIGIGFAVFASFLLMTFIATSISYKKREIGILRAVGARSLDVVNIFFNEAFIIAAINYVIALVGTIFAVFFINKTLMERIGFQLALMQFGFLQALYMVLIAIGTAFLASAIPVLITAKKKPIDAIRSE